MRKAGESRGYSANQSEDGIALQCAEWGGEQILQSRLAYIPPPPRLNALHIELLRF
jgi:hypothetical protein